MRLVRFLLQSQSHHIAQRSFAALVGHTKRWPETEVKAENVFQYHGVGPTVRWRISLRREVLISAMNFQIAGTTRGLMLARMNCTMSSMDVPGWKIAATPVFL